MNACNPKAESSLPSGGSARPARSAVLPRCRGPRRSVVLLPASFSCSVSRFRAVTDPRLRCNGPAPHGRDDGSAMSILREGSAQHSYVRREGSNSMPWDWVLAGVHLPEASMPVTAGSALRHIPASSASYRVLVRSSEASQSLPRQLRGRSRVTIPSRGSASLGPPSTRAARSTRPADVRRPSRRTAAGGRPSRRTDRAAALPSDMTPCCSSRPSIAGRPSGGSSPRSPDAPRPTAGRAGPVRPALQLERRRAGSPASTPNTPATAGSSVRAEVVEVDRAGVMHPAGDRDHPGRRRRQQRGQEQAGQREVPQVVRPELHLEPVGGQAAGERHHPGVVHQDVQRAVPRAGEGPHRGQIGQVERSNLRRRRAGSAPFDVGGRFRAARWVPDRQHHRRLRAERAPSPSPARARSRRP